jgi:Short C-terminal domain
MRRRLGRGRGGPALLGTAPVAPPAGPAQTVETLSAGLVQLGGLRDAGLLTQEEFDQQKARLLR